MRYENEIFENKVLKGTSLSDAEFFDCVFKNCFIDRAVFNGVSFHECRFIGSKIVNPMSVAVKIVNTSLILEPSKN